MASKDKMLELGENSAKRDGEAKLNSELKSIDVDKSGIELDSSRNSDLDKSDCVIIADDANETAAKTTDSNEKIFGVEQSPGENSAIEIADESAALVAELFVESECGPSETVSLEISSVAILEGKNADSSVTEEGKNVTENPTEVLITEMQSDAPKGADETDFVAGTLINPESAAVSIERPSEIDCEPSGSKSVILLDTPGKGERTAVATDEPMIDETIEINDNLHEEMADELFTNIDAETHSELDTPKKGDISIIDITTPPEKYVSNLADSEPVCDGKNSNENVRKGSVENVDFSETHVDVPLENVSEAPKTDEQSGELDSTKNIESSQQPLESPIAVAAETTESESQKSNAEIEENALKDVVESDSRTHQSIDLAENAEKTHETDVDGAKERMNIVSQAGGNIMAESADASAPATEKSNEPSEVKKNAQEKAFLDGECEKIDVEESIGDNAGTVACEETNKTHEYPTPIENELEEQITASNENMDESMETNEVVLPSTETDAPIPMDVDGEHEVRDESENKMDFEELSGIIDAVVAIKESNKSDGDAKDSQEIDETNTEPLDSEARLDVATEIEEENALETIAESEEKSTDRAPFIRVKSMAFLCSDGKKRISCRRYEFF